jgi:hypothetical protein
MMTTWISTTLKAPIAAWVQTGCVSTPELKNATSVRFTNNPTDALKGGKNDMAKTERLPGMQDAKIESLQNKAIEYAEVRDSRQKLLAQEVELKGELLKLMKKHKKDEYDYEDVHIELVTEEETVKVKIKKQKAESDK